VKLLLVLDDDRSRLSAFESVVGSLGSEWSVRAWRDAPRMIGEVDRYLEDACLISLDHDLYKDHASDSDPGSGRLVADHLCKLKAACPVIIHSTNTDAVWGMHNVLRSGGWRVELVHHLNQPGWIERLWLPVAARMLLPPPAPPQPAKRHALGLSGYKALANMLPLPTGEQIRRFVHYVAHVHLWYKHLRLLPARTPLYFFLDPGAGLQLVKTGDGRVTAVQRERQGFHYGWLPTAKYREQFGYLAFSRSAETRVQPLDLDDAHLIAPDEASRIHDPATGGFYDVPEEVLVAGRTFISGVVHEGASSRRHWQHLFAWTRDSSSFDRALERHDGLEVGRRIFARCRVLHEDPARAEPSPVSRDECLLAAFDLPLHELVIAERARQHEAMVRAIQRMLKVVTQP
jgi:hypothetical protein